MRDMLVFAMVFAPLPFVLRWPYLGVLLWSWLAYMNPHRLTWGAAFDFPFSQVVAIVTIIGLVVSRAWKTIPLYGATVVWIVFFLWTVLTMLFALNPTGAELEWGRWWKINLFTLVTLILMQSRERIQLLTLVIMLSLGFYGLKGGIFGIMTGGKFMVLGPPGSFIEGNTTIGLALIMALPLMGYFWLEAKRFWLKWSLVGGMALTAFATVVTSSRGALLGLIGMSVFLVVKSGKMVRLSIAAGIVAAATLSVMPDEWFQKMDTIGSYEEDSSAMGRINAWWFAFNLAVDRPVIGGGFNTFTRDLFRTYAPDPNDFHDAHSIYFEVMAEQGLVGFFIFLALGLTAYRCGSWVIRNAKFEPDLRWAANLAAMLQTSIVGYAICGAFLGHAYFDLYYHLIALLILTRQQVEVALSRLHPAVSQAPGAERLTEPAR